MLASSWEDRVRSVSWSDWATAYGRADDVAGQLVALRSDLPTALAATHELWCGLCHHHVFLSSAALPALPFLLESLDEAPAVLIAELLDILTGFAVLTAPAAAVDSPVWAAELRTKLAAARHKFDVLVAHPDPEVGHLAGQVVAGLEAP